MKKDSNKSTSDIIYVKDKIEEVNKRICFWIYTALTLNLNRALQVFTLLLNDSIYSLYFSGYKSAIDLFRREEDESPEQLILEEKLKEIIYGMSIYVNLKYKQIKESSSDKTDQTIQFIRSISPSFFNDFFIMNFLPLKFKLSLLDKLLNGFFIEYKFLPDLNFDPKFEKILKSDPINHLYTALNPKTMVLQGYNSKYTLDLEKLKKINEELMNPFKAPLGINPDLPIAHDAKMFSNWYGHIYFSSHEMITDLINIFIEYYSERIPVMKEQIRNKLTCFGFLLKATKGQGHIELQYRKIKKLLTDEVGIKEAELFLDDYCAENKYEQPVSNSSLLNYIKLIQEYHTFLKFAGYVHYGKIHTGCFLVWRAIMKYFETIQDNIDFKRLRGRLLEKWAYNEVTKLGFLAEKIILINQNFKVLTNEYFMMKENIKDFPKNPIELKFPFPDKYNKSCFKEFDLAIRVNEFLFIIECKGTMIPKSEWPRFVLWLHRLKKEVRQLKRKVTLMKESIEKKFITHPFLEGAKIFVVCHLKTEGIFLLDKSNFSMESFLKYFQDLRNAIEKGKVNEFANSHLTKDSNEENSLFYYF